MAWFRYVCMDFCIASVKNGLFQMCSYNYLYHNCMERYDSVVHLNDLYQTLTVPCDICKIEKNKSSELLDLLWRCMESWPECWEKFKVAVLSPFIVLIGLSLWKKVSSSFVQTRTLVYCDVYSSRTEKRCTKTGNQQYCIKCDYFWLCSSRTSDSVYGRRRNSVSLRISSVLNA